MAFQYAKSERKSLIDAYKGDMSEQAVRNAKADIEAINKLQLKLFGTTKSQMDKILSEANPINILDVRNIRRVFDEDI